MKKKTNQYYYRVFHLVEGTYDLGLPLAVGATFCEGGVCDDVSGVGSACEAPEEGLYAPWGCAGAPNNRIYTKFHSEIRGASSIQMKLSPPPSPPVDLLTVLGGREDKRETCTNTKHVNIIYNCSIFQTHTLV